LCSSTQPSTAPGTLIGNMPVGGIVSRFSFASSAFI
jgi:hypothetical protein